MQEKNTQQCRVRSQLERGPAVRVRATESPASGGEREPRAAPSHRDKPSKEPSSSPLWRSD